MSAVRPSKGSLALKAKCERRTQAAIAKQLTDAGDRVIYQGVVTGWANAKHQPGAYAIGLMQRVLRIPAPWWTDFNVEAAA